MTQSPKILINLAVIIAATLALATISIVRYMPYTGFMLDYDEARQAMTVVRLDDRVAKQGLQLGDAILSIRNANGMQLDIEPKHIIRSSSEARIYYKNRIERLTEIDRMYDLFSNGPLLIKKADGSSLNLILDTARPLSSLPLRFWVLFLLAIAAPLISALVWAWQPKNPETRLLLLSGVSFFFCCYTSAASINTIEMFYLPFFYHWLTRVALDLGQLSFAVFGTAVLLFYPNRLRHASRLLKYMLAGLFLYPLFAYFNDWSFSDLESGKYPFFTDTETYSAMMVVFTLTIILSCQQYRASKNYPVQRAQTLWIILAWTVGPSTFLLLYVLPRWLGDGPIFKGSLFSYPTLFTTYLMVLLGIARLNLFQLELYIGQAYQWVIVSLLFLCLDITLITWVNLSPQISSVILLIVVLWGYMPARQWIQNRLNAGQRNRNEALTSEAVVSMVKDSLDPKTKPKDSWLQVVSALYRPGDIVALDSPNKSSIALRGQQLIVAGNNYSPPLQLDFADGGSRLFSKQDLAIANTLSVLFEKLYDVRDSFLAGQTQERNRIRRDLHDQIGHKLLSLIYAAGDEKSRSLAQETMAQLSELIHAMKQEPTQLSDLAARIHGVVEDVCANAKLKLDWKNSIAAEYNEIISSEQFLNILNILRELLSNTIKHAGAIKVQVSLSVIDNSIVLEYSDDGAGFDQKAVRPGN